METIYVLFLVVGVMELMDYLKQKGYLKSSKSSIYIAGLLVLASNLATNPTFLTDGPVLTIISTILISYLLLILCMGSVRKISAFFFSTK